MTSSWNGSYITAHGGTTSGAETALAMALAAQESYFNIHTVNVGGGEIRGFLTPVPEPATFGLAAIGALGMLAMRRSAGSSGGVARARTINCPR